MDDIEIYMHFKLVPVITDVYDIKRYKWFCEHAWNDIVRIEWALNELLSKKIFVIFSKFID